MKTKQFFLYLLIALSILGCKKSNTVEDSTKTLNLQPVKVSPHSRLVEIPIQDVELTNGFWKTKFDLVKDVTIPEMFEYMHADSSSLYRNFLIASGQLKGEWKGKFWHDGDFYKWLEAVVYVYQITKEEKLDSLMDVVIDVIGKSQDKDGYISTYIQLNNKQRFVNKGYHELYNMGHLMTVAAKHYEATGKTNLINIGIKNADFLYKTFAVNRPSRLNGFGFNPSNIMGAIDIYRATGNKDYLALADTFVSMRGTTKLGKTITRDEYDMHENPVGEDNNQDRIPFRKETQAVGHAVTGTYLYAGAADLFLETGENALMDAGKRIWTDVVDSKISIHGGVGPIPHGVSIRKDKVHEAFGKPYDLPMKAAYHETCSNIGEIMWNWRLYKANPSIEYLELMEKVIYNSGLSGIGLDGFSFYYNNPLRRHDKSVPLAGWNEAYQRSPHIKCYCCPPQLARHIAGFRHYLYSVSKDKPELWINFYAASKVTSQLSDNTKVTLIQSTNYPWEGAVKLQMKLEKPSQFTLQIPVPGWADGSVVKLNGKTLEGVKAGAFVSIDRTWNNDDKVDIEMPMKVRLIKANPMIEQARNQIAVLRGPVVYCLESVDIPENVNFMDVYLKKSAKFSAVFKPELLGGIYAIETKALAITDDDWSGKSFGSKYLYKETGNEKVREIPVQLIPYHLWSNRGLSEMTIWIPITQ